MVYMIPRRNRDRDEVLNYLRDYKEQIDNKLCEDLEWQPDDGKHKLLIRKNANLTNEEQVWDEYQEWLVEQAEMLYFATAPYLAGFDAK
jgi:hypothetical protein